MPAIIELFPLSANVAPHAASHTKKQQPHNKNLLKAIIKNNITLIDYECLEHEDGQRIIGFGFFAGIVGAHNGIMAYGERTKLFHLPRVYHSKDYRALIRHYFGLKLPNIKIAITGSGRVAHGIVEGVVGLHINTMLLFHFFWRSYYRTFFFDKP